MQCVFPYWPLSILLAITINMQKSFNINHSEPYISIFKNLNLVSLQKALSDLILSVQQPGQKKNLYLILSCTKWWSNPLVKTLDNSAYVKEIKILISRGYYRVSQNNSINIVGEMKDGRNTLIYLKSIV